MLVNDLILIVSTHVHVRHKYLGLETSVSVILVWMSVVLNTRLSFC